ncbi:MAG: histidinol-phosphate transaminase [Halanaerobiaceae bacterium]
MIKLSSNENPYPLTDQVAKKVNQLALEVAYNRYPDKTYTELREALSNYAGFPADKIIAGNGSDELILLSLLKYGGRDSVMISPAPTFGMYSHYAEVTGTEIKEVPYILEDDFIFPEDKIMEFAKSYDNGLIFLCYPNNPTGERLSLSWLAKLLAATELMVVVDEAYYEFSGKTALDLLENNKNLIILRTLSKAFGLAGLRVGYLMADSPVIAGLNRIRSPYNISNYSAKIAVTLMGFEDEYRKQWIEMRSERIKLEDFLDKQPGISAFHSEGNFILFKTERDEEEIKDKLLARNIMIRYWDNLEILGKALRVSVGLPEENQLFKEEISSILEGV